MSITQLFTNLHNHTTNNLDFSESDQFFLANLPHLFPLNFNESGLQIKKILESSYTDGITGLEDVENDGNQITGVFLDQISPNATKRYRFTITPDNISYQLENPDDVEMSEAEFAAVKMFGGSKKTKKCTKGTACGNGCINKDKQCRVKPAVETKQQIEKILKKDSGQNKSSSIVKEHTDYGLKQPSEYSSASVYVKTASRLVSEKLGVSESDAAKMVKGLTVFTGDDYDKVKKSEKTGNGSQKHKDAAEWINKFIEKSPKYQGDVYRGSAFLAKEFDQRLFESGLEKGTDSLTSFSTSEKVAVNFSNGTGGSISPLPREQSQVKVILKVKNSKSGASVRQFSEYPEEDEVVVPKGVKYKIISKQENEEESKVLDKKIKKFVSVKHRVVVYEVEEVE
ncbi:ADP-ribosyltransferase [Aulosira sp. FACHB-615]|uniref:ADP-ribosyltransferase n=1 Tax=Aulosira sp. FACHB-615 TaxID=2692777 RepID=UPI0016881E37|nr:ADP-ribosyltransferase [Aulosira sp. FACHB-615]MBD2492538.1 hypothetical protein [Aulosira sp. FACHB-615]